MSTIHNAALDILARLVEDRPNNTYAGVAEDEHGTFCVFHEKAVSVKPTWRLCPSLKNRDNRALTFASIRIFAGSTCLATLCTMRSVRNAGAAIYCSVYLIRETIRRNAVAKDRMFQALVEDLVGRLSRPTSRRLRSVARLQLYPAAAMSRRSRDLLP